MSKQLAWLSWLTKDVLCSVVSLEHRDGLRRRRRLSCVYRSAPEVDLSCRRKSQNVNRCLQPLTVYSCSSCLSTASHWARISMTSRSRRNTSRGLTTRTITVTIGELNHRNLSKLRIRRFNFCIFFSFFCIGRRQATSVMNGC